ncbi:MAG: hypothetical protein JXM72_03230 [Deltaproteobacteria bacterium]|nr:hypothetical protein [Deltaproteobacteria bacterium]
MNTRALWKKELSKILTSTPSERARSIIDSQYTREILEQLSAQEAYMIVKDSWGTDSQILLPFIAPETICNFIDLDCWEKDSLSMENVIEWLWEIYTSSPETLQQVLDVIDLDLIILLYQSYMEVMQVVPTDEDIPNLLDTGYESYDDVYFFRFTREDEKIQLLKDMLSLLFTHYQNIYYGIMEGVMWEFKSSMEENIFERRTFRLMEMGFPPSEEAMSIYRRTPPEKLLRTGIRKEKVPHMDLSESLLPSLYMDHISENKGLIVKALEQTNPETRDRFIYETIYLSNKIIMADYRSLNEIDELKKSIDKAAALTSLGLAIIMKETKSGAAAVLEDVNAETLFSLGYNIVSKQQQRLKIILKDIDISMIPDSMNEYVDGLLEKRPLYKDTDFSTIEQLEQVTQSIDRIEAFARILKDLAWDKHIKSLERTNTGTNLDLENIILTCAAINFIEQLSSFRPLLRTELLEFLRQTTRLDSSGTRTFLPDIRNDLTGFLHSFDEALDITVIQDSADLLIRRLESEISGIEDLEDLDTRFITCFVVTTD